MDIDSLNDMLLSNTAQAQRFVKYKADRRMDGQQFDFNIMQIVKVFGKNYLIYGMDQNFKVILVKNVRNVNDAAIGEDSIYIQPFVLKYL